MNWNFWVPLLLPISSFVTAVIIFLLKEEQTRLRSVINLLGALFKIVLVAVVAYGVYAGIQFEARLPLLSDLELILRVDDVSLLFLVLSSILWLVTTVYAIGYLEGSPHRSRFFLLF